VCVSAIGEAVRSGSVQQTHMFLCSGLYEWVFSQSPESVIRASMKEPAQVSLHNANEEEKTPGGSRKDNNQWWKYFKYLYFIMSILILENFYFSTFPSVILLIFTEFHKNMSFLVKK